jgi:hypothetical protein
MQLWRRFQAENGNESEWIHGRTLEVHLIPGYLTKTRVRFDHLLKICKSGTKMLKFGSQIYESRSDFLML